MTRPIIDFRAFSPPEQPQTGPISVLVGWGPVHIIMVIRRARPFTTHQGLPRHLCMNYLRCQAGPPEVLLWSRGWKFEPVSVVELLHID